MAWQKFPKYFPMEYNPLQHKYYGQLLLYISYDKNNLDILIIKMLSYRSFTVQW